MKDKYLIAVVDGQGGGIGKQIVETLKNKLGDSNDYIIRALGTNSAATSRMIKSGADDGATGENAIVVNAKKADIIIGVVGIIIPESILGELTSKMAHAIATSEAYRVLIPINRCNTDIAAPIAANLQTYMDIAVDKAKLYMESKSN